MFAPYLKAYAALIGSVCSALLGVYAADSAVGAILLPVSIVATTFATFQLKNAPETVERDEQGAADTLLLVAVAILVLVVLLFFGYRAR